MFRVMVIALALLSLFAAPASASGGGYGATTLALDPATADVLVNQLGVIPAPIAPARAKGTEFAFPITNSLRSALRSGTVRHSGGIALTAGGTTVELRNFDIKLLRRQLLADIPGVGEDVPILDLDFAATRIGVRWGGLKDSPGHRPAHGRRRRRARRRVRARAGNHPRRPRARGGDDRLPAVLSYPMASASPPTPLQAPSGW